MTLAVPIGCASKAPTQPSTVEDVVGTRDAPAVSSETGGVASSPPTAESTSGSASVPTVPAADEAVLAAYKNYYETIYELDQPTAQQVRDAFAPYAEPHVVDNWVAVFESFAAAGKKPSGVVTFGPIQVSVSGSSAAVVECRDATSETMTALGSGEIVGRGAPGARIDSTLAAGADGAWRVRSSQVTAGGC